MNSLYLLPIFGLFAQVYSNGCHTVNGAGAITCGNYTHMSCNDIHYVPYCHQDITASSSAASTNGICTCEKFCVDVSECTGHCPFNTHHACAVVYVDSVEKICRCRRH